MPPMQRRIYNITEACARVWQEGKDYKINKRDVMECRRVLLLHFSNAPETRSCIFLRSTDNRIRIYMNSAHIFK